jgi:hypothetical protein
MVSNLDFVSLKNRICVKNNPPFETLVFFIILLAFLIIKAKTVLFPLSVVYLASAPVVTAVRRLRRKPGDASADPTAEEPEPEPDD